ncbi:DUF2071 domain-containing protein [Epilithonimonas sp. JDS]|uniref:YqjF family protein n=1 Tax=Epilithonimonas sp. JDS TaxID=2902797 RepID=UPI001E34F5AB|nr:DUF2071 domain-containing protein [Epilithonimonas sp. JDS]MCD9855633.1 DUF2071 domain-containing protein [Epilithonimonas sp. JDS]
MKFLTAEWRKLAIINYEIDPEVLKPYLPKGTQLDFHKGKCLVSLVGFMFLNTKLLGISVPFHKNFEEVNLRFYVKKLEKGIWKRGVVFIKEIVPKNVLSLVANTFYNENYWTLPMSHSIIESDNEISVSYSWQTSRLNKMTLKADNIQGEMIDGSDFEFITEHYFGFTKNEIQTSEYEVKHPKWNFYDVKNYEIKVDFKENYGIDFIVLNNAKPISIMLAEGSEIEVHTKKSLEFAI